MSHQPTLLLTGSQGFLGRHIARLWLREHRHGRVVGVGRSGQSDRYFSYSHTIAGTVYRARVPGPLAADPASGSMSYRRVDLTDAGAVRALVAEVQPTAVVHAAGSLRGEPLVRLIANNVVATVCLARAVGGLDPQPPFVLVSSGSVYAVRHDGAEPEPEPYAVTKQAAEAAVALEAEASGLPVAAARVFNLVGPGLQDRHLPSRVAFDLEALRRSGGAQLRLGCLDARRDLIDVEDAAGAVVALATADLATWQRLPREGAMATLDVGRGVAVRMRDVVTMLIDAAGLTGRVQVSEDPDRPAGPSLLMADGTGLDLLGAAPRIPIEQSLAALSHYAQSQW